MLLAKVLIEVSEVERKADGHSSTEHCSEGGHAAVAALGLQTTDSIILLRDRLFITRGRFVAVGRLRYRTPQATKVLLRVVQFQVSNGRIQPQPP